MRPGRADSTPCLGSQTQSMEWMLKFLDDLDDLRVLARVQTGPVIVTALLLAAFLAVVAGVFVLGSPDLLAAP
jgi:hypothetical protein